MKNRLTKNDYINEILRLNRVLVQCKCDEEDDKHIKRLIAENLSDLGRLEESKYEIKQRRQEERQQRKYGLIPLSE